MQTFQTDVLCVGAGLAGERVAIAAAADGYDATCLSIVPARRSHSSAAQGGMQVALGNCAKGEGDSCDVHFEDTVRGSDWGADQEVVRMFADMAPVVMREMAHWGVPWNTVVPGKGHYYKGGKRFEKEEKKEKEGLITARAFGGTAKWRTCYTSDGTGHTVLFTMDNRATQLGVEVHDKIEAVALIHDGEACMGVMARCLKTGELRVYPAKATVMASGGFGRIYRESTNAVINDGGGHIFALDTGLVRLGNMEAIQFHPTGIVPTNFLVTEGCRGDGGTLLDVNEERFMHIDEPAKAELASRDVVSQWRTRHIQKGLGVKSAYGDHLWLDIRHLGKEHITTKLREVDEICQNFLGVNPVTELIPVRPTQHYSMGGIRTNKWGAADGLERLFAVGEVACWDMHGFNRLGGNSLAETVVAGKIIGEKLALVLRDVDATSRSACVRDAVSRVESRIAGLVSGSSGKESVYEVRNAMQDILMDKVGIFRTGRDLDEAVTQLQDLHARAKKIGLRSNGRGPNPELSLALRMPGQVRLALCVACGAAKRTESRGYHSREDYPARNDRDWLNRSLATWNEGDDLPTLEYEPASPTVELPPGDRGYGTSAKTITADDPPCDSAGEEAQNG